MFTLKFSPKKMFTRKLLSPKNFRLSFVDLRWAQLYVSLVIALKLQQLFSQIKTNRLFYQKCHGDWKGKNPWNGVVSSLQHIFVVCLSRCSSLQGSPERPTFDSLPLSSIDALFSKLMKGLPAILSVYQQLRFPPEAPEQPIRDEYLYQQSFVKAEGMLPARSFVFISSCDVLRASNI